MVLPPEVSDRAPVTGSRLSCRASRAWGLGLVGLIVGANLAIFVYQSRLIETGHATAFVDRYAVSLMGLREGNWWQLFTHLFLHGGDGTDFSLSFRLVHIGINMLIILLAGKAVVRRAGIRHFSGIYVVSGVLGAVLQVFVTPKALLLGASASAFGLVTAYAAMRSHEILYGSKRGLPLRASGASLTYSIILSCILLGVADLVLSPLRAIPFITQVGHFAHLGGALAGLFYCRIFGLMPKMLSRKDLVEQREANEQRLTQPPTDW